MVTTRHLDVIFHVVILFLFLSIRSLYGAICPFYISSNDSTAMRICDESCCTQSGRRAPSYDTACCQYYDGYYSGIIVAYIVPISIFLIGIIACCCYCCVMFHRPVITPRENVESGTSNTHRSRFHRFNLFSSRRVNPEGQVVKDEPPSYNDLYTQPTNSAGLTSTAVAVTPVTVINNEDNTDSSTTITNQTERISSPPPPYNFNNRNRGNRNNDQNSAISEASV